LISYSNYSEKISLIKSKQLSLPENVRFFLNAIETKKNINAFNFVFDDIISKSEAIDKKIQLGAFGKLAGLVVAVKDVISIEGKPLTCSSKILRNFNSVYNATIIDKLLLSDALLIGKTNCDEFAMGSSNENSAYGAVLNPINEEYVPGGSSGGSAAAVAARLCDVAIGTDTGGSIRQPASFCGIYGIKPTYGRVSRYGLTAFASSFDSIGAFAKNIFDLAIVMETISGNDEYDSTSSELPVQNYSELMNISKKFKIGIPKEYFAEGLDGEVKLVIKEKISRLKKNGFEIVDISLPHSEYAISTYYILTTAEASANLSRYDGVHYGHRNISANNLNETYELSRTEAFGDEVKRRIMLGTYVLSSGYYDAYYVKAQRVRRLIKNDFEKAFSEVDLILTPTSPTTAFKIGEKKNNPLQMYLSDIYTTSANLAGIPAISIPAGYASNGLPVGLQILANQFQESLLFQIAKTLENLS